MVKRPRVKAGTRNQPIATALVHAAFIAEAAARALPVHPTWLTCQAAPAPQRCQHRWSCQPQELTPSPHMVDALMWWCRCHWDIHPDYCSAAHAHCPRVWFACPRPAPPTPYRTGQHCPVPVRPPVSDGPQRPSATSTPPGGRCVWPPEPSLCWRAGAQRVAQQRADALHVAQAGRVVQRRAGSCGARRRTPKRGHGRGTVV